MKRLTPAAVTTMTIVAIGLLVSAYFAKLIRAEELKAPPIAFRNVPIATGVLEPGTELTAENLRAGRVRVDQLDADPVLQERNLVGRVLKERVAAGAVIRSSQLYQPGEFPPVTVSSGMRAVSMSLDGASSASGLFHKGQFVDVHFTPKLTDRRDPRSQGEMTLTLFRGVRLLGTAPDKTNQDTTSSVTLELTPEQANVLILARTKGEIDFSYNPDGRSDGEMAVTIQDRATLDEILGLSPTREIAAKPAPAISPAPSPAAVPAPHLFVSESYKGSTRSILQFRTNVLPNPRAADAP